MKKDTPKNRRTWATTMYSRSSSVDLGSPDMADFMKFRKIPNSRVTMIENAYPASGFLVTARHRHTSTSWYTMFQVPKSRTGKA